MVQIVVGGRACQDWHTCSPGLTLGHDHQVTTPVRSGPQQDTLACFQSRYTDGSMNGLPCPVPEVSGQRPFLGAWILRGSSWRIIMCGPARSRSCVSLHISAQTACDFGLIRPPCFGAI